MEQARYVFRSQEHSQKVAEIFVWAGTSAIRTGMPVKRGEPVDMVIILNHMREHHEYDEVFKGLILTPTEDGFTMFKEEDVLEGIKLN